MVSFWIGGTGSWFDPVNWSTGVVPGASDTVDITTATTVGIAPGSLAVAADVSLDNPGALLDIEGTLSLAGGGSTLAVDAGTLKLGGTLENATVDPLGGSVVTTRATTLNDVTWVGPLVIAGTQLSVAIEGGLQIRPASGHGPGTLTLRGTEVAVPSVLQVALFLLDSETLDHLVATVGNAQFVAPGFTLTPDASAGTLTFGSSATIDLSGITEIGVPFVNAGTIADPIGDGDLSIGGNLTNSGTIAVKDLGAAAATFVNRGAITVARTMDVAPPVMNASTDDDLCTNYTLAAADFVENDGSLVIAAGGTLTVGSANPSNAFSTDEVHGADLDNTGLISVGAGGRATLHLNSLNNAGTIDVGAGGTLALEFTSYDPVPAQSGGFANAGVISVGAGGTLQLLMNGTYTLAQLGTILADGASVHLGGGTLDLGGQTVTLGAGGLFGRVTFGDEITIANGTVDDLESAPVLGTATLDNVTWIGPLAFGAADVVPPASPGGFPFLPTPVPAIGAGVSVISADGSAGTIIAPGLINLGPGMVQDEVVDVAAGVQIVGAVTIAADAAIDFGTGGQTPLIYGQVAAGTLVLQGVLYATTQGAGTGLPRHTENDGLIVVAAGDDLGLGGNVAGTLSGTGTVAIAAGGTFSVNASGMIGAGQTIAFRDGSGTLKIQNSVLAAGGFAATIANFAEGDQIVLAGATIDQVAAQGQTVTLLSHGTVAGTLAFADGSGDVALTTTASGPTLVTDGSGTTAAGPTLAGMPASAMIGGGTIADFAGMTITDAAPGLDSLAVTLTDPTLGTLFEAGDTIGATASFTRAGTGSQLSALLESLVYAPNASDPAITEQGFIVTVTDANGTTMVQGGDVTSLHQYDALATLDPAAIVVAASGDGGDLPAAVAGFSYEALVQAPAASVPVFLPPGYRAVYLGGTANATLIDGGVGNALLLGNGGSDVLYALGSNDTLRAAGGADTLVAVGAATMNAAGSSGQDVIFGGAGATSIQAAASDTIVAGAGATTVIDAGTALVALGAGAATVRGGALDTIFGGGGAASIVVGRNALVALGSGPAQLELTSLANTVFGGGGTDSIGVAFTNGVQSAGTVFGGSATTVLATAEPLTFAGGTGSDTIYATSGGVFQGGSAGHNVINVNGYAAYANVFPTAAFGGGDGDVLQGTGMKTVLVAGPGAETLFGADFGVRMFAGGGADAIILGTAGETAHAGTGSATIGAYGTSETVAFDPAHGGGTITITGFGPSLQDFLDFSAYGAGVAAAAASSALSLNGSTVLTLTDGTRITLVGVTSLRDVSLR